MDWVKNLFIESAYKTVLFTLEEESELIDIKNDSGHKLQYFELIEDAEAKSKLEQT